MVTSWPWLHGNFFGPGSYNIPGIKDSMQTRPYLLMPSRPTFGRYKIATMVTKPTSYTQLYNIYIICFQVTFNFATTNSWDCTTTSGRLHRFRTQLLVWFQPEKVLEFSMPQIFQFYGANKIKWLFYTAAVSEYCI